MIGTHFSNTNSPIANSDMNVRPQQQMTRTKRRHMFTKEEDAYLRILVMNYGDNNWTTVSKLLGNRTARQCKERYLHYLSPYINNSPFNEVEDNLLLSKVEEYGRKWTLIVPFFHSRTEVALKNRYNVLKNVYGSVKVFQPTTAIAPPSMASLKTMDNIVEDDDEISKDSEITTYTSNDDLYEINSKAVVESNYNTCNTCNNSSETNGINYDVERFMNNEYENEIMTNNLFEDEDLFLQDSSFASMF